MNGRIEEGLKNLDPGCFALVMATGSHYRIRDDRLLATALDRA